MVATAYVVPVPRGRVPRREMAERPGAPVSRSSACIHPRAPFERGGVKVCRGISVSECLSCCFRDEHRVRDVESGCGRRRRRHFTLGSRIYAARARNDSEQGLSGRSTPDACSWAPIEWRPKRRDAWRVRCPGGREVARHATNCGAPRNKTMGRRGSMCSGPVARCRSIRATRASRAQSRAPLARTVQYRRL
jgi:hypothetical protein